MVSSEVGFIMVRILSTPAGLRTKAGQALRPGQCEHRTRTKGQETAQRASSEGEQNTVREAKPIYSRALAYRPVVRLLGQLVHERAGEGARGGEGFGWV